MRSWDYLCVDCITTIANLWLASSTAGKAVEELIVKVANGEKSFDEIAAWMKADVVKKVPTKQMLKTFLSDQDLRNAFHTAIPATAEALVLMALPTRFELVYQP